jgi:hypothetical protein
MGVMTLFILFSRETAPVLSIIRRAFNGYARLMRKSHLRFLRYANDDPLLRGINDFSDIEILWSATKILKILFLNKIYCD